MSGGIQVVEPRDSYLTVSEGCLTTIVVSAAALFVFLGFTNGMLKKAEAERFYQGPHQSEKAIIRRYDYNKDGVLNGSEIENMLMNYILSPRTNK